MKDDRRGARRLQQRVVPSIGDEGEIPRLRLFDARDADNLDVTAGSLEAAPEPFSNVAQLQDNSRRSRL